MPLSTPPYTNDPSSNDARRRLMFYMFLDEAELARIAIIIAADRAEGTAKRLRGLAPELHRQSDKLRRLAALIDIQMEAAR